MYDIGGWGIELEGSGMKREKSSQREGQEEEFEEEDDIGRKGRKKKGENVSEKSLTKACMTQRRRNY